MKCDSESGKEREGNNRTWSQVRQGKMAIIVQREALSMEGIRTSQRERFYM